MATDATGTPTSPDNIPKYNTAVDKPSGKGFNAAMDAIQTALDTKIGSSSDTPASNEVPVWNGSDWVYQKLTDSQVSGTLAASKLAAGTNGQFLKTVGSDVQWTTIQSYIVARSGGTVEVANTVTETALLSYTIPGGIMDTQGMLRVTLLGDIYDNATGLLTIAVKLGGTTLFSDAHAEIADDVDRHPFMLKALIGNVGSASTNYAMVETLVGSAQAGSVAGLGAIDAITTSGGGGVDTSTSINTANNQLLEVTATWSTASVGLSVRRHYWCIEAL